MPTTFMQRLQPISYNALRIVAGIAFMTHGGPKLFGLFTDRPAPAPLFQPAEFFANFWPVGLAGILEFFGGIMMALGLFAPQLAFVLCGEMAVVYFWRHWGFGDNSIWWWANRGETPLLYCYIWLLYWGHGSGSFSVDAWWQKRKAAVAA